MIFPQTKIARHGTMGWSPGPAQKANAFKGAAEYCLQQGKQPISSGVLFGVAYNASWCQGDMPRSLLISLTGDSCALRCRINNAAHDERTALQGICAPFPIATGT